MHNCPKTTRRLGLSISFTVACLPIPCIAAPAKL